MHSTDQHEMARLVEAANPFQAHIWQQALQQEGIHCQVLGTGRGPAPVNADRGPAPTGPCLSRSSRRRCR